MPRQIKTSLFLFAFSLIIFIWGLFPGFVLSTYSNGIYPYIATSLRAISSIFPFALGDVLYAVIIILLLIKIIKFFLRVKQTGWQKNDRVIIPFTLLNAFLIFYLSFKILWGLNYSRPSITKQLQISDEKYTLKELIMLGDFFINKVNLLKPKVTHNLKYTIEDVSQKAIANYIELASKNSFFIYKTPSVKSVLNNWAISKIGIEGYYNPLSGEANINMGLPAWLLPFVTCHEMAHQLGVAREDEANLVAYLVGSNSNDLNFQYSVDYNMLRYILFEIRYKAPDDYIDMRNKISPAVLADFKAENEFWAKYDGHMTNYMGQAFDKFLKLNNQDKGIKSYQDIVVWLWNLKKTEVRGLPLTP